MAEYLLAHMNVAPFVQQAALALHEAGSLGAFATTLIDDPGSHAQRWAKRGSRLLGLNLQGQLARRKVTAVPPALVETHAWRETVRMLQVKLRNDAVLGDRLFHWARDGFDGWVASRLESFGGFYGYEYGSRSSLRRARELGIPGVLDLPSPEHDFAEGIIAAEVAKYPELMTDYRRHALAHQAERTDYRRQEWEAASQVVTASNLTRDTWLAKGWGEKPVVVVPYGAPPVREDLLRERPDGAPLRLVWAGTFSVRKGAHLMLEAWRAFAPRRAGLELHVYGAVTLPDAALSPVPEGVVFQGSRPQAELFPALAGSAALVFPTLCDGFGMVVTEAFSLGVPVITTPRAGAADLVRPGENGWLIEAGSVEAIILGLEALLDARNHWTELRDGAVATARGWQWSDYRRALAAGVLEP